MIRDILCVLIQRLVEEVGSLVLTLRRVAIGRPTSKGNYANGGSKRGKKRGRGKKLIPLSLLPCQKVNRKPDLAPTNQGEGQCYSPYAE